MSLEKCEVNPAVQYGERTLRKILYGVARSELILFHPDVKIVNY